MTITLTTSSDYHRTSEPIGELLDTLIIDDGLCPVCVASSMMCDGAMRLVSTLGTAAAIEECERLLAGLRGTVQHGEIVDHPCPHPHEEAARERLGEDYGSR